MPNILSKITKQPREKIEVEWSNRSWVHNIFRVYEILFWRRAGIRKEASSSAEIIDGQVVIVRKFYTFEALLAHCEGAIRSYFTLPKFKWVEMPQLAYVGSGQRGLIDSPIFRFAIAVDNTSSGSNGTAASFTFAYTTSGSNRFLANGNYAGSTVDVITGETYAGNAMTRAGFTASVGLLNGTYLYWQQAPTTGANNLVMSFTPSTDVIVATASYTGAKQTGQPDNTTSGNTNATSITSTLTTVADNCWAITMCHTEGGGLSAGTGETLRVNAGTTVQMFDTNGVIHPAASYSMTTNVTGGAAQVGQVMMSFAPAGAAVSVSLLTLLGVG